MSEQSYASTLKKMLSQKELTKKAKVLVVCGGTLDRDVLFQLGFENVTISNIDERIKGDEFAPYAWSFQDVERLSYGNEEFDFVIVHAGLHHCLSPVRGLLEMYRTAKTGILVLEARDSLLINLALFCDLTNDYEVAAVVHNNHTFGGCRNSAIPNYIYRWTEKEVIKTISSYAPQFKHKVQFFYGLRMPYESLSLRKSKAAYVAVKVLEPITRMLHWLFPKQCNEFAFLIKKPNSPEDLWPWLEKKGGEITINRKWTRERF